MATRYETREPTLSHGMEAHTWRKIKASRQANMSYFRISGAVQKYAKVQDERLLVCNLCPTDPFVGVHDKHDTRKRITMRFHHIADFFPNHIHAVIRKGVE